MHNTLKILNRCKYPESARAYPIYPALDTTRTREEQAERFISALDEYRQQHANIEGLAQLINSIVRDAVYDEIVQDKAYGNDMNPLQLTHRIPTEHAPSTENILPQQNRPIRAGRTLGLRK